ncbi:hypothetical protein QUF80_01875 [Desulfococcaceae bacterium HSG8]|nr:hypothetical protein [Desulfococcaceae bacterium HSG8]
MCSRKTLYGRHIRENRKYSLREGFLLIYDFNKNKEYRQEQIVFEDKRIFAVWV